MIEELKKAALNQAMKIMQDPRVTKFMSDPRVMNAITKGFEIQSQIRTRVESTVRSIAERLNLAPKSEQPPQS